MHSNAPAATTTESQRLGLLKEFGCIACRKRGLLPPYACGLLENHHLLRGGRRIGHHATVCLGAWHHRGAVMNPGDSPRQMLLVYGPSLAVSPSAFRAEFGSDEELLAEQNRLLREAGLPVHEPRPRRRSCLSSAKVIRHSGVISP